MRMDREYLSIAEAARLAGVCRRTVYNWMERGQLAFVRLPSGMRRVRKTEVIRVGTAGNGRGSPTTPVVGAPGC